jgi:hypothetical protein
MVLETSDRRSLFQSRSPHEFPRTRKRPARTPPSTFLFLQIHLSNSPEAEKAPTLRQAVRPSKLHTSDNFRMLCHCSSEELSAARGRAVSGRRRRGPVYRLHPRMLSTEKDRFSRAEFGALKSAAARRKTMANQALGPSRRRARRTQAIFVFRPRRSISREATASRHRSFASAGRRSVGRDPRQAHQAFLGAAIDAPEASRHRPPGRFSGGLAASFLRCGKLPSMAGRRGRRA